MAVKNKTVYVCTECGAESPKWSGKCPACGQWDTMTEFKIQTSEKTSKQTSTARISSTAIKLSEIDESDEIRTPTNIEELDRVLGGGIVQGSLILVTGEPGIGKSTILLQICLQLGMTNKILYVSGEESPRQIKLRAERLADGQVYLLAKTDIEEIVEYARMEKPDILIIDSIQTMQKEDINSSPGSVSQVKEATSLLMNFAKSEEIPVFIVGHVNKEGAVAGPKVMEHMVDAVLYFEGDRSQEYRILRAVKNRFGSTNEIGVFEMTGSGLKEVKNPSQLFLQGKPTDISGIATACVMEGTRPLVAEIQSLVAPTPFPAPRRVSVGFDYNRLNLIIAVLEKRCKLFFGSSDTYLNIIGGIRLDDPAADLAVAIALASGLKDFIIPDDTLIIGELGLAGEIRAVTSLERRIIEAKNLGFKRCLVPSRNKIDFDSPLEIVQAENVRDALNKL